MPEAYSSETEKHLSASGRRLFKKCPWAYRMRYVEGISPIANISLPLVFGGLIHEALEGWYVPGRERGVPPWETFKGGFQKAAVDPENAGIFVDEQDYQVNLDLGLDMLRGYVEHYGEEPHLEVIQPELEFEVPLKYKTLDGEDRRSIMGFLDLVYRDHSSSGTLHIMEHKTAKSLSNSNQFLPLDEQASVYLVVATQTLRDRGLISSKEVVHNMVYNYLQKTMSDTRPRNPQGLVCNKPKKEHYIATLLAAGVEMEAPEKISVKDLTKLAEDAKLTVFGDPSAVQPAPRFARKLVARNTKEMKNQVLRLRQDLMMIDATERELLPTIKNPTRDCGFCEFSQLCILDEQGSLDLDGELVRRSYTRRS
jgi:gp73